MIATFRMTLVSDALCVQHNRKHQTFDITGDRLIDYMPEAARAPEVTEDVLWVTYNGCRLHRHQWEDIVPRRGDQVSLMVAPADAFSVVLFIVTAIVSAWQIYDATRRAKIQAHHAARRAAAQAKHMGDSPTYSWGGMTNTINPGGPIQLLFGGPHRVAGHFIFGEPQVNGNMDCVIGIGEGELEGPLLGTDAIRIKESIEINGKPGDKWSGLAVNFRPGTTTQLGYSNIFSTVAPRRIQFFGETAGGSVATKPLTPAVAETAQSSAVAGEEIDGYEVEVFIPHGVLLTYANLPAGVIAQNRPGIVSVQLAFQIRHRTLPGGSFVDQGVFFTPNIWTNLGSNSGKPLRFNFRVPAQLTPDDYEIELTWLPAQSVFTPNVTTTSVAIGVPPNRVISKAVANFQLVTAGGTPTAAEWSRLREYREFTGRTPGLATLGLNGIPLSAVGGMLPTITSVWEGRKIRDVTTVGPPGVLSSEEFRTSSNYVRGRNPALAILDILTNTRYGAGQFIDIDKDLDLQSFVNGRDFCDTLVSRGLDAQNPLFSGTANGVVSALNQFQVPASAGIDFTDGVVRVDDTLVLANGPNSGSWRIVQIVDPLTVRLGPAATPLDASVSLAPGGGHTWTIINTERFALVDYYIDGFTTIWKVIEAIAQNARMAVVRSNGKIGLVPDEYRSVAQVFGSGTIDKFQKQYMGSILSNRVECQFLDEEKNWEQAVAQFEDAQALTDRRGVVRTQVEIFGVTRRSQATRIAKYHWLSNRLEREMIEFETDARALAIVYGDVIQVNDPAAQQFTGAHSGLVKDVQGSVVILDDQYLWDVTGGASLFKVQRADTNEPFLVGVVPSSLDGVKSDRIDFGALPVYTPQPGDEWIIEQFLVDDPQVNLYKVVAITRTEDHRRKVRAVTFNEDLYRTNEAADPNSLLTNANIVQLAENDPT